MGSWDEWEVWVNGRLVGVGGWWELEVGVSGILV